MLIIIDIVLSRDFNDSEVTRVQNHGGQEYCTLSEMDEYSFQIHLKVNQFMITMMKPFYQP
jgi:hypothetical protein